MSEQAIENAPVEPVGSGDAEWDAAQHEAQAENPVQAPEPVAEEAPVAPETPVAAEPDADFTFATLESGQKELRLSTGEVYRGATDAEVMANLAKGKVEANRHIQQLKQPAAPTPASVTAPAKPAIDPAAEAIADYAAQGFGFANAAAMREAIGQFQQSSNNFSTSAQEMAEQQQAMSFIKSTPDFVATPANGERIDNFIRERKLPYTQQSMEDAFYALKGRGLLEGKPVTPTAVADTRKNNMPAPPTGNSPVSPIGGTQKTLAELEAMTTQELEAHMDAELASR